MDDSKSQKSNSSGKNDTEIQFEKEFQPPNNNLNRTTEVKLNNKCEMKNTVLDNFINQSIINGNINGNTINRKSVINDFRSSLIISNDEMNELINKLQENGIIKQNNNISNENSYLQSSKINIENFDSYIKKFTYYDAVKFSNIILELDYNITESYTNMAVHPLINISIMIEESFNNDENEKNKMEEKYKLLKDYIYYRKIKGDGNCFYRAIIFKYLEIIILNKEIDLLKYIILDVNKCFKNEQIKQKLNIGTLDVINPILVQKILISIYFLLNDNDVKNAYKLFYKSINMSRNFDMGLILYFRYTIFQYIEQNQNKLYKENFPIQIGNLLPEQYETDDGTFLFNQFYDNYLLKLFNDAEKIVIYLTPFIFPIKLNIILFEESSTNFFQEYCSPENIDSNNIITVIYKKEHFELIYSNNENENFKEYLFEYINNDKNSKFLELGNKIEENIIIGTKYENGTTIPNKQFKNIQIIVDDKEEGKNSTKENKNISKSIKEDLKKNDNETNDKFEQINKSEILTNKTTIISPISIGPFKDRSCEICKSLQNELFPSTQMTICNKCFKKELIKEFERKYFSFITQIKKYVLSNKKKNYENLYDDKFYPYMNTGLKICKVVFTIEHLKKFSYNFEQYLLIIKKKICINCQKHFMNNNVIQIPCGCVFCGINCINEFFSKYVNLNNKNLSEICCLCCTEYSFSLIYQLRTVFQKYKLNDLAIKVTNVLNKQLENNCAKCDSKFNKTKPIPISYNNVNIKSSVNSEILNEKLNLNHFLCFNCFKDFNKVQKIKLTSFKCVFCQKVHYEVKKK